MKSLLRNFTLILLSLSIFWGCKKSSPLQTSKESKVIPYGAEPAVKNDWLVVAIAGNPSTLNPILKTDAYATDVTGYIFDSLLTYDSQTGDPVAALADSWTVSPDALEYRFKLRKDIHFHDGKILTADDVKFSFDIIRNPKVDAAHLQNYYQYLDKVEVLAPDEIKITVKQAYFRNLIMIGGAQILPKHIYGVGDFNTNPANQKPVGTGAYQFSKWDQGRSIELKRFDDYWGNKAEYWKGRNNFNRIILKTITEDSVRVMALKKGDIDSLDPTTTQYLKDFNSPEFEKTHYRLKYNTDDGAGYNFIGWNLRTPLFQSVKIRKALAHCMPRDEINKKMFEGIRTLAVSDVPQSSSKIDPSIKPMSYDLDKARELLAEEGWIDANRDGTLDKGGKEFKFELLFAAGNAEAERIALIYQQSLKTLGIEMNIRTLEWTVFIKQLKSQKFDAVMLSWTASLDQDPYQIWHSSQSEGDGSNFIGYKNTRADELLTTARTTMSRDKRNLLYQEFSKILADEAPYLFLFQRDSLFVADKRFAAVEPVGKLGLDSSRWFTPKGLEKYTEAVAP